MFVIKHLELIKFSRLINLQGVDMPYPNSKYVFMFVIKHLELIKFSRLINLQGVDMPYPNMQICIHVCNQTF